MLIPRNPQLFSQFQHLLCCAQKALFFHSQKGPARGWNPGPSAALQQLHCLGGNMPWEETDPVGIVSNGIRKTKLNTGDRLMSCKASKNHGVMLMSDVFPNLSTEPKMRFSKLSSCTATISGCFKHSQHHIPKQCDQPDQKESKLSTTCSLFTVKVQDQR